MVAKKKKAPAPKAKAKAPAKAKKEIRILEATDKQPVKLLDPSSIFFVERSTGTIDIVTKASTGSTFTKELDDKGKETGDILYYDRGVSAPPEVHVSIEEMEALVKSLSKAERESVENMKLEPDDVDDAQ